MEGGPIRSWNYIMPTLQTYRPPAVSPPAFSSGRRELRSPLVKQSLDRGDALHSHDGAGWLVLALTFCVLSVGWVGYFQPQWSPSVILSGGNDSADLNADESPMMEAETSTEPPAAEPEEVTPPEAVAEPEELPEPVPVVNTADAFTVPAPPEIVPALRVTEPRPDRPRPVAAPKPSSAPRSTKPAAGPAAPAAGSAAGSGGGSGTGQGAGSGKKAKTPQPPYPGFARSGRMTGTVVVSIQVDAGGGVISANVVRSCGFPQLDSYTSSYILSHWRWPEGGRRTFTQPVSFRLR